VKNEKLDSKKSISWVLKMYDQKYKKLLSRGDRRSRESLTRDLKIPGGSGIKIPGEVRD
jgi:hypothetical protein